MSKGYFNYYPQISDLPVDEQEKILEKARYEAFVKMKLSGISALYLFGSLILFFIPFACSIAYFGYFSLTTLLSFTTLCIGPTLLNSYLQSKLIHKGLKEVLSSNNVSSNSV